MDSTLSSLTLSGKNRLSLYSTQLLYDGALKTGVTFITLAGMTSLIAIIVLFFFKRPVIKTFKNVYLLGYFLSLLGANVLQGMGTLMDLEWVIKGRVSSGSYCSVQGALKEAGSLGVSFWSLIIVLHLSHLLFLRIRANKTAFISILCFTWSLILVLILIGQFSIEKVDRGPYYGITTSSCWITSNYKNERMFMDYLFSFISMGLCLILYIVMVLRIQGNIVTDRHNKWKMMFSKPHHGNVTNDSAQLETQKMLWYPLSYVIIMFPITIARIVELSGGTIAIWALVMVEAIVNLMGFFNVFLLIYIVGTVVRRSVLPQSMSESSRGSIEKSDDDTAPFFIQISKTTERYSQADEPLDKVAYPVKPQNVYVAPDSWNTTAPRGRAF
jgi:hypothetical protein